jgi:hypothetical protein
MLRSTHEFLRNLARKGEKQQFPFREETPSCSHDFAIA